MSRRRGLALFSAALLAGLLVLAGCDAGGHSGDTSGAMRTLPASSVPANAAGGGAGSAPSAVPQTGSGSPQPRALVRSADLTLQVGDVAVTVERAARIAAASGGAVFDQTQTGSGAQARADLTLQVPTGALPRVVGQLGGLGRQLNLQTGTQDVTTTVADVGSRVTSMQAAIARLRTLYARAGSIPQLLDVAAVRPCRRRAGSRRGFRGTPLPSG